MPKIRPPGADRGRPKGSLNKATRAIKEIAEPFGEAAVGVLAAIMTDPLAPHPARVAAATALLDRGFGRPSQSLAVDLNAENTHRFVVEVPQTMEAAEWQQYAEFKQQQQQQPKPAVIEAKPINGKQPLTDRSKTPAASHERNKIQH